MSKEEKSKKKDVKPDSTCPLNPLHAENSAPAHQNENANRSRSTFPRQVVPLDISLDDSGTNGGSENSSPEPRHERHNRSRSRRRNRHRSHSRSRNAQTRPNLGDVMEAIFSRGRVAGHVQAEIFFDNMSEPEIPEQSETFVFSFADDENDLI